ncbi:MAG TPA: NAD(P)/FAD-dependent oxidoreductase [Candidatus Limnocylindria bacterium]|nr:NAD(P)/FAD-dependent oxidoreductase [Candidatus Limnocylindria bacterium]
MPDLEFDAVILGGGSAGYAAARTLASGGAKCAVIEGGEKVGGLCILRGCMPTKALLHAAELREAARQAESWGITSAEVSVDLAKAIAHKDRLIEEFASYRRQQLSDGRFAFIRAMASFIDPHQVRLDDGRTISAKNFIIATGSTQAIPPVAGLVEAGYLTSATAINLTTLPKTLAILGGGAVAVEFAQYFARFGVQVTLIQRSAQILKDFDTDVANEVTKALHREGIRVLTRTKLERVDRVPGGTRIQFTENGESRELVVEEILNGLGRIQNTASLHLDRAAVMTDHQRIVTTTDQQTSQQHIYAAGDCCGPHEIVHIAIQQGEIAAHNILHPHKPRRMDHRLLLSIVFSDPQVACVGMTEAQAKLKGLAYVTAQYPFNDHGKSIILGSQEGFVKLMAAPDTGEILGGACVGPQGGELIHEIVVAMSKRMTVAELAQVPHYHPTLSEIWTYPAEDLAEQVGS